MTNRFCSILKLLLPALLSGLFLSGCTCQGTDPEIESAEPEEVAMPGPVPDEGSSFETEEPVVGAAAPDSDESQDYIATLTVTQKMKMRHSGNLIVSIGSEAYQPHNDENIVSDVTSFSVKKETYARIIPYAPDFRVEPEGAKIVKLNPAGTDVRFTLYPQHKGKFSVSADVVLYDNPECTGTGDPRVLESLMVRVKVGGWEVIEDGLSELGGIVWDKFRPFWTALVALIFAALFFVIRRFIKEKTGYSDDSDNDSKPQNET